MFLFDHVFQFFTNTFEKKEIAKEKDTPNVLKCIIEGI